MGKTYEKAVAPKRTKVLAAAGVLIAMNIVLTRFVAIPIGNTMRITVGATPVFLAGLWFGPAVGGICGGISDLIGCILQGYAINPLITLTSVSAGVISGLMSRCVFRGKLNYWRILIMVLLHGLIGSMGFTTLGLHLYYGTPWRVLLTTRALQSAALVTANSILTHLLYRSSLTDFITQNFFVYRPDLTAQKR